MLAVDPAELVAATPTSIIVAFVTVSLSMVGLMGWVLRHVFLTTIPALVADQKAQREGSETNMARMREANELNNNKMRESNERNLASISNSYKAESEAERALCREQFTLINTAMTALTAVINQEHTALISAVNQHTTEAITSYRHELYDKLNQAVLGREAYQARKKQLEREKELPG